MSERVEAGSVILAVDGSEHSRRAVSWAAEQAVLESRRLVAVTVGDRVDGEAVLHDAVELAHERHPGLPLQSVCLPGDPREVLLDLSARAHLLVVGSRGRGTLKTMLLGSVSREVSAHAACPVIVCRPAAADGQRGVVVGADGTPESLPVIEFAYRQAALRALPLTVLHCFWDPATAVAQYRQARGQSADAPELDDLRVLLSQSTAGLAEQFPDVPVTFSLRHGLVDEALTPRGDGWSLVVVGRHPMTSLGRLVTGSMATAVVERARTTVAVVPEGVGGEQELSRN